MPGHEVAGIVDAVGPDVPLYKVGRRVGLGWHGGHCNYCPPCRRGDFILCENAKISGIRFDGGYADYVIAPANALALIPDDLSDVDAAPLMCAGVTTFNSLRHSGATRARRWRFLALAGWGIWPCSLRPRADTVPWLLLAGRTRLRWRSNWARTFILTAQRRIPRPSYKSWAEHR